MPLPWDPKSPPLMLAPMQGLTNRALRGVYAETVKPDLLFTEFVRVRPNAKVMVAQSDFTEALAFARKQEAVLFELRAATALAGLSRDCGHDDEVHGILAPVFSKLNEGYDNPDLRDAAALLGAGLR